MRIVTVRIDAFGTSMELKSTPSYIGFSVSEYIQYALDSIIKKHIADDGPAYDGAHILSTTDHINITVETGGEF